MLSLAVHEIFNNIRSGCCSMILGDNLDISLLKFISNSLKMQVLMLRK